jgi:chaperonin GroES
MAKKSSKAKVKSSARKLSKKAGGRIPTTTTKGPIIPLRDEVVVRRLTEAEMGTKSSFGIIIPDTVSKEKPEQGIVVAVGPGKWDEDGVRRIPMSVVVGDRVVFSKYGYDDVTVGGEEYILVSETNIRGVIRS